MLLPACYLRILRVRVRVRVRMSVPLPVLEPVLAPVPVHVPVPVPVTAPMCHTMPYSSTGNSSFTIALSLLCANPHSHVRATTREAARPQPQDSEDATGYWAADSLLPPPLSPFLPFPPAPSVLAR